MIYRNRNYPKHNRLISLIQEYAAQPFLALLAVYAGILYVLMARRMPLTLPGIGGLFLITMLSGFLSRMKMRNTFVELSFNEQFFYLASVDDLARQNKVDYFPLAFASPSIERGSLYVNYKDRVVRINPEEWQNFNELSWYFFHYEDELRREAEMSQTGQDGE